MGQRPMLPWIILYGIVLHACWGLIVLRYGNAKPIAAFQTMGDLFGSSWGLGVACLLVAGLAAYGMLEKSRRFWWFMPQQMLMVCAAADALRCVWTGRYADGYVAPWDFILKDQLPAILVMVFHTCALIDRHRVRFHGLV